MSVINWQRKHGIVVSQSKVDIRASKNVSKQIDSGAFLGSFWNPFVSILRQSLSLWSRQPSNSALLITGFKTVVTDAKYRQMALFASVVDFQSHLLKVMRSQNEHMKSSHCPKYKRNIREISTLYDIVGCATQKTLYHILTFF